MRVRERWIVPSRQPLSFVRTDEISSSSVSTELLGVEVQVLLEVFSAGEAAVKHLIRFILAAQHSVSCAIAIIKSSVCGVVAVLECTIAPGTKVSNNPSINNITVYVTPEC